MATKSQYLALLSIFLVVSGSEDVFMDSCLDSSCAMNFNNNPAYCYCDRSCPMYGDCCHDANVTTFAAPDTQLTCVDSGFGTYWMITGCSRSWMTEQLADGVVNLSEIVSFCENPDVIRTSFKVLPPPVTDKNTGSVYRNEFCARCNGVLKPNDITWKIQLTCENSTTLNSGTNLTFNELFQFCSVEFYRPPTLLPTPRTCKFLPEGLISTCPQNAPLDLKENCALFGLNLVKFGGSVYANAYCAACWNDSIYTITLDSCLRIEDTIRPTLRTHLGNIAILLDISGTGRTASSSIATYSLVEEVCPSGSVYDIFRGSCRTLPSANCTNSTAITLAKGSYYLINNQNVFWNSYELNVSIESVNDNGRPLVCIPSVRSSYCVPIILDHSEYIHNLQINPEGSNNSSLVWLGNNETYIIEGTDHSGRPLICTNLTQNFTTNNTQMENILGYPLIYSTLSYIGVSIDFVSCLLFLLTFFLFKDLRTFFSKLMVNFVFSILLGDVIFLFGGPFFTFISLPNLCIAVGIILHYVYLCRFFWMTVMWSEMVKNTYNIRKLNKSPPKNWKLLTLYILLAWLIPLVIVIPTIIVNFTVDSSVNYGIGGGCWINQPIALIVTFVIPVGLSIVFNVIAFVIVMVVIGCIRCRPIASSLGSTEWKKQTWKDFRFALALLTVTGLSWVFGFLALFASHLSWAWYLFIIFNTTQALTIVVAFLFTKKVFHLYRSVLCCSRKTQSKQIITKKLSTAGTKV